MQKKVNQRWTHIALVVDVSGSMYRLESKLTTVVNNMLNNIRSIGTNTKISIVKFGSRIDKAELSDIRYIHSPSFNCNQGSTRLFDAIGESVECIDGGKNVNHLVMVFTDGFENSSSSYNKTSIKKLIAEHESRDNWTFTIQLPSGNMQHFIDTFGIPAGNLREWEQTEEGLDEVEHVTTQALNSYYDGVSRGIKSTKTFYVTTDLSKLKKSDIKKELVDMKNEFSILKVDREEQIRDFVERKTKRLYKQGMAYYQLSKREKITPKKQILLMEKGKPNIWAGDKARSMIGLKPGLCVIEPGNHANFDIFCLSTSVNRKLVRGTSLLVKKNA